MKLIRYTNCRDLFREWVAQGFPLPKISEGIVLKYWNMSDFPLLKEPAIDNPLLIPEL